ncbi:MAG: 16S rRNA (cytidine(1402)-2'-O)-methyltransferase, partial [Thermodesulfobacteriota bacterium]
RELTKLHEEIVHGTLYELSRDFSDRDNIKGEITLIIKGYQEDKSQSSGEIEVIISNRLKTLNNLGLSLKDSVKVVCEDYDISKRTVYDKALRIWDK